MKVRFCAMLSALMIALGIVFTVASPALALDGSNSRIVNYSASTITGGYSYNAGGGNFFYKSVNVARNTAFGEPGRYEPRTLRVGPNRCMKYHFHVYGQRAGSTSTICAGSTLRAYSVFFGNGYSGADYDVVVTAYYAR